MRTSETWKEKLFTVQEEGNGLTVNKQMALIATSVEFYYENHVKSLAEGDYKQGKIEEVAEMARLKDIPFTPKFRKTVEEATSAYKDKIQ